MFKIILEASLCRWTKTEHLMLNYSSAKTDTGLKYKTCRPTYIYRTIYDFSKGLIRQ